MRINVYAHETDVAIIRRVGKEVDSVKFHGLEFDFGKDSAVVLWTKDPFDLRGLLLCAMDQLVD